SECHEINFFFSSRRRHTRFSRDWSSDVCSSDLWPRAERDPELHQPSARRPAQRHAAGGRVREEASGGGAEPMSEYLRAYIAACEIGRASCRESKKRTAVALFYEYNEMHLNSLPI